MAKTALTFVDDIFMRFSDVRENLVRIPEIYDILSRAQRVWDQLEGVRSISLHNVFYRNEDFFETHPEVLNLMTGLVQLGMLTRLRRQNYDFRYILAKANPSNPADLVFVGQLSFESFIRQSPALKALSLRPQKIRLLSSRQQKPKETTYRIFCKSDCGLKLLDQSKTLLQLVQKHLSPQWEILSLSLGVSTDFNALLQDHELNVTDFLQADATLKSWLESPVEVFMI